MKKKKVSIVPIINKINSMNKFEHFILYDLCRFDREVLQEKLKQFMPELKSSRNQGLLTILCDNIIESYKKVSEEEVNSVLMNFYNKEGDTDKQIENIISSVLLNQKSNC